MVELSKRDIQNEFLSCGKNPAYFIDNFAKIEHPTKGVIPFKTWPFQKQALDDFGDFTNNIILKSRQLGISTLIAGYCAWLMTFHRSKRVLIIATKIDAATNIVKMVKFIIKNLPKWFSLFVNIDIDNQTSFTLTNGSKIKAIAASEDAGRSEAASLVIIDEAAHIPGLETIWTSLGPTLSTGGRCIVLSSPLGLGNWFHQEWVKAENGENDFHPIKLDWKVHPDRDAEWEEKARKKFDKKFAQEYECSFLASGDTFIEVEVLQKLALGIINPLYKLEASKDLWVWELYSPVYNYMLVCDWARGDGFDHSTIHVIKLETFTQVAEYKSKLTIDAFAELIDSVGRDYGNAMVVVENNGLGYEINNKLFAKKYPNIYYQEKGTHVYVPPYSAMNKANVIAGFTMTPKSRPMIISKLEECVRNEILTIRSERTIAELRTFIWNNGKPEAMRGKNDDLIIPLAIACEIRDIAINQTLLSAQNKRSVLNNITFRRQNINTAIGGMSNYSSKTNILPRGNSVREEAKQNYKKFGWLF